MIVGYARVSTLDQDLETQIAQLTQAGCEKIFSEQLSGATTDGRDRLKECLVFLRPGDVLIVTRLDRLARSVSDFSSIMAGLLKKDVGFRCILQASVDTTNSQGRLMLNMLAAFAEFENDLRRERQREGIDRAKAAGVYKGGRPKAVTAEAIREVHERGFKGAGEIAKRLGVSRRTVYRRAPELFGEEPGHLAQEKTDAA